jgi:hypothetical protein
MNVTLSGNVLDGLARLAARLRVALTNDPRDLVVLTHLARYAPDERVWFPEGQHRTLQDLDRQLDAWARDVVDRRLNDRERYDAGER